jgi:hypothetical protein
VQLSRYAEPGEHDGARVTRRLVRETLEAGEVSQILAARKDGCRSARAVQCSGRQWQRRAQVTRVGTPAQVSGRGEGAGEVDG